MNRTRRLTTVIAAPALSMALVAGGVVAISSPAQASSATKASKSKQVALTPKGSSLSASEIKSVLGAPQKAYPAVSHSENGLKGYVSLYRPNSNPYRPQMASSLVARSKSAKAVAKDLKVTKKSIHTTSYKYSKKTQSGYVTGWTVIEMEVTDETGKTKIVKVYAGISERGRGKTMVQTSIMQIQNGSNKVNFKLLVKKADKTTRILAKRYKI